MGRSWALAADGIDAAHHRRELQDADEHEGCEGKHEHELERRGRLAMWVLYNRGVDCPRTWVRGVLRKRTACYGWE